jgi:hypothetical protein
MRELVLVGPSADVRTFRQAGMRLGLHLAQSLGLAGDVQPATDPFFAPTAKGRALLQQVKGLKHELRLDVGGGRNVAGASFNDHEQFFGTSFDIRLPDGEPAASGCVAFGIERWVLAFLVAHGPDAAIWPDVDAALPAPGAEVSCADVRSGRLQPATSGGLKPAPPSMQVAAVQKGRLT